MAAELSRGVTQEQVMRIKARYESATGTLEGANNQPDRNRIRKNGVAIERPIGLPNRKNRKMPLMKARGDGFRPKQLPSGRFSVITCSITRSCRSNRASILPPFRTTVSDPVMRSSTFGSLKQFIRRVISPEEVFR